MNEMKKFLGFESEEEKDESCFPSLSYKERLIGFCVCFGLGILLQILSMGSTLGVVLGKPEKFAVLYTFGNIISIFGTFFLFGPSAQISKMKDESRREVSIIFVGSLIMTLVCVYILKAKLLTIVFLVIQFCSYIWYCLSYIPFGRSVVLAGIKSTIGIS